jgi:CubicO group peptidase (beta-lactamase class C family)
MRLAAVVAAAERVLEEVGADDRFNHTSHLQVRVGGETIVDEHLRGALRNDVFSITKSVLATALGAMAAYALLPPLDSPVAAALPQLRDTPARTHTWYHLLTMTRGAQSDGPWEIDAVAALPAGHISHIARAPQLAPPGQRFRYDNGGPNLLAAAATEILGEPVSTFAARTLFEPLGIADFRWRTDPEGYPVAADGLQLTANDLGAIGQLWLDGGRRLIDPGFLAEMTRPHTAGGPPEGVPYGFLTWLPDGMIMAGGWGGQHLLVIPAAAAVVVTTGDPGFDPGPPPTDKLAPDWQPALSLVRRHLIPALLPGR